MHYYHVRSNGRLLTLCFNLGCKHSPSIVIRITTNTPKDGKQVSSPESETPRGSIQGDSQRRETPTILLPHPRQPLQGSADKGPKGGRKTKKTENRETTFIKPLC